MVLLNNIGILAAGFGIGIIASSIVGLWDEMPTIYRVVCLFTLLLSLYIGWELSFRKNEQTNSSKDYSANSPS